MISLFTVFFFGLFLGWALTRRMWVKAEHQRTKSEMNDEIDLRDTPDNYLSEVELMKKRYIEAKWKEGLDWANRNRLINSKPIPKQNKYG